MSRLARWHAWWLPVLLQRRTMSKQTTETDEHLVNLETLGSGACNELFDDAFQKVLDNIADVNTSAKTAREVNLKVILKPDEDRRFATIAIQASAKLAPAKPFATAVFIGRHGGKVVASE